MADNDMLIQVYFELGMSYKDIAYHLGKEHQITYSERHLKRILKRLNLSRRKYSNLPEIIEYIQQELTTGGQLYGYRMMYEKCRLGGIRARMEDVRLILRELDPEGVEQRRSRRLRRREYFAKGPNFIWHIDGYDKLKPFGLAIHGCICGFSRKIIWLNVYNTNSNSRIIGSYFLEAVVQSGGTPRIVRGDYGTENVLVRDIQWFLRRNGTDSVVNIAYLDGASTANQRIERWWGFLMKNKIHFWRQLFLTLQETGQFSAGFLDKNLVLFCFISLIQDELDKTAELWNAHRIRPSKNQNVPNGRPDLMYYTPGLWGSKDYICPVVHADIVTCKAEVATRSVIPCDLDVYDICMEIIRRDSLELPNSADEALDLYLYLRDEITLLL